MSDLVETARPGAALAAPRGPLRATDIRAGMSKRWAPPEYAIMWEVTDATGARHRRTADAVIMSLWPSRGLELHGVEIKVSKADWRREALTPQKAEIVAAYCDRWWVHTSPGVVRDLSELPPAWGLREFDGVKWTTIREASLRNEVKPCDRSFLASLLRRADVQERISVYEAAQRMIEADRAAYEDRIKTEVDRRTARIGTADKIVEKFEAASGVKITDLFGGTDSAAEIGALVKAILATGITRSWESLATLNVKLKEKTAEIDKALRDSGLPFQEQGDQSLAPFVKRKRSAQ